MNRIFHDLGIAVLAFGAMLVVQHIWLKTKNRKRRRKRHLTSDIEETHLHPPFPNPIVDMLQSASLCHMGVQLEDGTTHLCLMSFTYVPEEQIIVMSTRRNTTKYRALENIDQVTLLIHNFATDKTVRDSTSSDSSCDSRTYSNTHSITLYGNVTILSGDDAEDMRSKHLKRHGSTYSQFIVGKDIAVLSVEVESAKICNIKDEVTTWDSKTNKVVDSVKSTQPDV